jgi:2-polyprenyl-6-methoxyphenol hydroxylase-like FAD-dependent oxidoreductase
VGDRSFDVIVVGARCAASPLAMLLARQGVRVLLVDRATFPSDTVSTHVIHPPGVAALRRWGLLDQVTATGCPPVGRYPFDAAAAAATGAAVREGFSVEEVLIEDGRAVGIRGRDRGGRAVARLNAGLA